ncbi:hypothetical protein F444_21287 [Phytophthora nicotianae P1976]|uniref:PiggyBac transposable element-derived protein domain-containing protein n=1 Tax=Phytophthora nicotianae P1976 TaxID=1317066 RepID=A0A080Z1M7_PHYNI|nr:hypothetical protein F444_21287 [Phytophthora nicotianae P1976]
MGVLDQVLFYANGLKPRTRSYVKLENTETLSDAMDLAVKFEVTHFVEDASERNVRYEKTKRKGTVQTKLENEEHVDSYLPLLQQAWSHQGKLLCVEEGAREAGKREATLNVLSENPLVYKSRPLFAVNGDISVAGNMTKTSKMLLDCGATTIYVSKRWVEEHQLKTTRFSDKNIRVKLGDNQIVEAQQVCKRASKIQERQSDRRRETVKQITRRLKAKSAYATHEILHVVGLLVARMLCPQKRRFGAHWSTIEDGAVPAGLFGRFMTRDRCHDIMRDLHFVDNTIDHGNDKLWKLRPVVDKIQERFLMGWSLPAIFSFDEDVLPATSKRNTTRMFMADKPHRYGSKLFMVCDAKTAYWYRFEVYVGKRASAGGPDNSGDYKTGAAAVVRNLKVVLAQARHMWHTVVIDRYYSSVLLAIEFLSLKVYVIGTIMTNRLGFNKDLGATSKTRPASIHHGTFSFSRSVAIPTMISCVWWDRKPCPSAVNDYKNWMSGVDIHDQLRLQSYSLQMSTRFTKYYKSLFLGLMDMVMVNAYLTHKEGAKIKGAVAMKRSEWFCVLQNQLLQLKAEDFAGVEATPPPASQKRQRTPVRLTHALQQSEDWVTVTGVQKRRQRSCKVYALLRTEKKKFFATTFFCERCSVDNAKCWLCNRIRREYKGVAKTCFDIWHDDFDAGQAIPPNLGKRIVLRRPGQKAGQRKKTRRELRLVRDGDSDDGNGGDNENGSDEE